MRLKAFDRNLLNIKSLAERKHDLDISAISQLNTKRTPDIHHRFKAIADHIIKARERHASIILMMGAHVIRAGVQNYFIDLMERGYISCIAMNGAGMIHDFELALIGATTEPVAKYIKEGQFGLWKETGWINDYINEGYKNILGMGEAVGKAIFEGNLGAPAVCR